MDNLVLLSGMQAKVISDCQQCQSFVEGNSGPTGWRCGAHGGEYTYAINHKGDCPRFQVRVAKQGVVWERAPEPTYWDPRFTYLILAGVVGVLLGWLARGSILG